MLENEGGGHGSNAGLPARNDGGVDAQHDCAGAYAAGAELTFLLLLAINWAAFKPPFALLGLGGTALASNAFVRARRRTLREDASLAAPHG
jgi:hypothetical protein